MKRLLFSAVVLSVLNSISWAEPEFRNPFTKLDYIEFGNPTYFRPTLDPKTDGKFDAKEMEGKLNHSLDKACATEFISGVIESLNSLNASSELRYLRDRFDIDRLHLELNVQRSEKGGKNGWWLSARWPELDKDKIYVLRSWDSAKNCKPNRDEVQTALKALLYEQLPEDLPIPPKAFAALNGKTVAVKGSRFLNEARIALPYKGSNGEKLWLPLRDGVARLRVEGVAADGTVKGTLILPKLKREDFYPGATYSDEAMRQMNERFEGEHPNYQTLKYYMLGDLVRDERPGVARIKGSQPFKVTK
jgi:hypothetical protein